MAQLSLYIDDETARRLQAAAEEEGVSQSQWVARLLRARLDSSWPASVAALAGAWPDFPTLEVIRAGQSEDAIREPM